MLVQRLAQFPHVAMRNREIGIAVLDFWDGFFRPSVVGAHNFSVLEPVRLIHHRSSISLDYR
jgi:hypothetical protein